MRSDHRRNAPADGWSAAGHSRGDRGEPRVMLPRVSNAHGFHRRTMVCMRRGSKRAATDSAKVSRSPAKPPKLTRDLVARIHERREEIRQRAGILSDSAILIREDRDR